MAHDDESTDKRKVKFFGDVKECSNSICTSKYNWATFVPQNLFEQFHSLGNVYFLVIAMMQAIPAISITSGRPLILGPLSIVLGVAAMKDALEDLKRKQADQKENERCALLIKNGGGSTAIKWGEVHPGQLLKLVKGDGVPADAIVIDSAEGETAGCMVETMNLDGETNMKRKACAVLDSVRNKGVSTAWDDAKGTFKDPVKKIFDYDFVFEQPTAALYDFKGRLEKAGEETIPLSANNLLLRGSSIQQTAWVICLVTYCGHDTRIMKNSQFGRFKLSKLDIDMNRLVMIIFCTQLVLCLVGGLFYTHWEQMHFHEVWYEHSSDDNEARQPFKTVMMKAGTWLLQLNNMVPISLLVTLTTVKFIQCKFIQWDDTIRDRVRGLPAQAQTCQVLESLGQVTHVFSDKTGTLTCNEMVYKCCSVQKAYENSTTADVRTGYGPYKTKGDPRVDFDVKNLVADVKQGGEAAKQIVDFLLCHALCHTVDASDDGAKYAADSPDEDALVSMARFAGLQFVKSTTQSMTLRVDNADLCASLNEACGCGEKTGDFDFKLLDKCDFDNDRKRMSVIVRYPNDQIVLLVKGADSSMLGITGRADAEADKRLTGDVDRFAGQGLRTLILGQRKMTSEDHEQWHSKYQKVLASTEDSKTAEISRLAIELEEGEGLTLLGATAIEDKLQDQVPDTIESIRRAGISVWVLTGDKVDTAINIGYSCKLLTPSMNNFILQENEDGGTGKDFESILKGEEGKTFTESEMEQRAITVTGAVLAKILANPQLTNTFYSVCLTCRSVVACRVSPKQKADVVDLCKSLHESASKGEVPVTLAIGDGANDVAMINSAHVGVGLSGKEGAQAARSADFAIAEFKFLKRLMFLYGREAYRKNAVLVNYNFYKNFLLVLPPFLFGPWMSFSGQPFYAQAMYQLFNVTFTSIPIMLYAIFDRPYHEDGMSELETNPDEYVPGRKKELFGPKVFILWMSAAFFQACCCTFIAWQALGDGTIQAGFTSGDLWSTGSVIFFWVIIGANLTLSRRCVSMFWFTAFVTCGSVVFHPVACFGLKIAQNPVANNGEVPFLYGGASLRFILSTILFCAVHLLVGEPLITSAGRLYGSGCWSVGPPQRKVMD